MEISNAGAACEGSSTFTSDMSVKFPLTSIAIKFDLASDSDLIPSASVIQDRLRYIRSKTNQVVVLHFLSNTLQRGSTFNVCGTSPKQALTLETPSRKCEMNVP